MKIKAGDTVKVIAGKDKGKTGEVLRTYPKDNKVIVENVNIVTRHTKPRGAGQQGGISKSEAPINVSNVMYYDTKNKKTSKIGYREENGKKVRFAKSSDQVIDK